MNRVVAILKSIKQKHPPLTDQQEQQIIKDVTALLSSARLSFEKGNDEDGNQKLRTAASKLGDYLNPGLKTSQNFMSFCKAGVGALCIQLAMKLHPTQSSDYIREVSELCYKGIPLLEWCIASNTQPEESKKLIEWANSTLEAISKAQTDEKVIDAQSMLSKADEHTRKTILEICMDPRYNQEAFMKNLGPMAELKQTLLNKKLVQRVNKKYGWSLAEDGNWTTKQTNDLMYEIICAPGYNLDSFLKSL